MKSLEKVAIAIFITAAIMQGQSQPHTYSGFIVKANCYPATQIVNRNSRGYVPSEGAKAFVATAYKPVNVAKTRKSILKYCLVNPGATEFALLDDSGNFFKLDEKGNYDVLSQTPTTARRIRATVTGSVDRERLNVRSISKN